MQEGFIKIPRSFFESGYWRQSRTYNDCEAILDIIQQVRFEASEQFARIGGREVIWGQAEWPASVRFLAQKWKWSEKKVRIFLASLKKHGIITTNDTQGVNIIRLENFDMYQQGHNEGTDKGTDKGTTIDMILNELQELRAQQGHSKGTARAQNIRKKEYNNIDSSLHSESYILVDDDEYSFEKFWELYDCKVGKSDSEKLYNKLSREDRVAIFQYVPRYKEAQPDKQYRKRPQTFLRQRAWEDEIIKRIDYGTTTTNQRTYQDSDRPATESEVRQQSISIMEELRAERLARQAEIRVGRDVFAES